MIKKLFVVGLVLSSIVIAGCRRQPQTQRYNPNQTYERFINSHVFAACENVGTPQARYSLASLLQRPQDDRGYYKVKFINGPCKGVSVWTTEVIRRTSPVEDTSSLPTGTVVLRNFDNPKEPFNKDLTDHWNLAVIVGTERADRGILDLGFPRDRNDFFPARESIYLHNIRLISNSTQKDIRQFIK